MASCMLGNERVILQRLPMILRLTTRRQRGELEICGWAREVDRRSRLFAVVGTVRSARVIAEGQRRRASDGEPRVPFTGEDVLSGVLIPVVSMGVAVDVVHTPVIPALERMIVTEAKGQAVLQPHGPGDGVILGKVPV